MIKEVIKVIITNNILDEKVPIEILPTRLDSAMNLYTNITVNKKSGILVYNTNPDTWNTLYPFYEQKHKFTIDNYKFSKENITYRELLEEYQKVYHKIYEIDNQNTKSVRIKTLIEEYKKTFNLKAAHIGEELLPIFELKYSKSKNVWTLYYFENYVVDKIDDLDKLLNQKLYDQKILPLDSNITKLDGVELTSNIPYLLSLEQNIEKLKKNIIEMS